MPQRSGGPKAGRGRAEDRPRPRRSQKEVPVRSARGPAQAPTERAREGRWPARDGGGRWHTGRPPWPQTTDGERGAWTQQRRESRPMSAPLGRARRSAPQHERQRGQRARGGAGEAERSPPAALRAPETPPVSSERNMAAAHREGVGCLQADRPAGHAEAKPEGRREAQRRRRKGRRDPVGATTVRRRGTENASGGEASPPGGEMDRRTSESPRVRARQWRQDQRARTRRARGRRQESRSHGPR